jgi:hypothetical protein
MKKVVVGVALLAMFAFAGTAAAQDVCPGTQFTVDTDTGTFDATGTNTVTTAQGITITLSADGTSATFDLPAGIASAEVCVKAGSAQSGGGTKVVTVTDGETVSGLGGHEISHVSVISTTTTPPPPPGPQPPGPQPPGPQPPGPQPPGPQPPGPQPPTPPPPGGGAGGTPPPPGAPLAPPPAAPPSAGGGGLPFTGLPVWIPMLAGAGLLGSGLVLMRRRRDAES